MGSEIQTFGRNVNMARSFMIFSLFAVGLWPLISWSGFCDEIFGTEISVVAERSGIQAKANFPTVARILKRCEQCHYHQYVSYEAIVSRVARGDPEMSTIFGVVKKNQMPKPPAENLTRDEKAILYAWIKKGAPRD